MSRCLSVLILAAACGGSSPSATTSTAPPSSKASCATAATTVADQFAASLGDDPDAEEARAGMLTEFTAVCERDQWSAASIDCFTAAKAMADFQACAGDLTPDQRAGLGASMAGDDAPGGAPKASAPPAPPPPGDDLGADPDDGGE